MFKNEFSDYVEILPFYNNPEVKSQLYLFSWAIRFLHFLAESRDIRNIKISNVYI